MSSFSRLLRSTWLGFALAGLFFYPLAAALDSDPYYLQWQPSHSTEAFAALALLTVVFAALLYVVLPRTGRGATVALGAIALVPLLSLGAGLSRQLPIDDALRTWWENPAVRYGIPLIVAAILAAGFALKPTVIARGLQRMLLVLSPIALVVVVGLARPLSRPATVTEFARPAAGAAAAQCPSMLALLFDELSYAYTHDGAQVRAEFPNMRAFAASATNYTNVRAPGDETMISVPGYLAGRPFDNIRVEGNRLDYEIGSERAPFTADVEGGLFPVARAAGFSPEVVGYYFPYCELLGRLADTCRSFSFYNIANADPGFSPLHPIMTTLILWPRQFPLGLFKNPPFAALQRTLVEQTEAFALRPIPTARPVFRFVHFSIPHLPFVFDADGYNPPLDPLRQRPDTAYVNQLHYADRLLGEMVADMKRAGSYDRTTIVVFADHGFRSGGRETNSRHVPFLVKRAGQTSPADVVDQLPAEQLLLQTVREGCPATP